MMLANQDQLVAKAPEGQQMPKLSLPKGVPTEHRQFGRTTEATISSQRQNVGNVSRCCRSKLRANASGSFNLAANPCSDIPY